MANSADIKAVITAEDKASRVLEGFSDKVGAVGSAVASALKVAAVAAAAATAAAVAFGVSSVKAFEESQNVQAQLNSVLQSTHTAAGLYIEDLNDQAKALQRVTTFSDEQINSSQALLLTFTNIHGAIFQQATPAILDLATAMHEDLQSASIQVGKALNDPVLGITALHRIGVTFSDTQKQQIQNFVDTNQVAKAQGVILAELTKEFGGSATAAAHTFAGSIQRLKNSFNDFQELVGQTIIDRLQPFIDKAIDVVASINWQHVIDRTIQSLIVFGKHLDDMWQRLDKVYQAIEKYLAPKLEHLFKVIQDSFPTFKTFITEYIFPLAKAIGTSAGEGLVLAIGLLIDTAAFLIEHIFKPLFAFMDENKGIVYALVAAFVTLKVAMMLSAAFDALNVGFATLRLVTIPSTIASLETLQAFLVGFGGFAIIAAAGVAAFVAIRNSANETKAAIDSTMRAIASAADSEGDSIKKIENAYAQGKISKDQEMNMIHAIVDEKRAMGGPVVAGRPYVVGEQGEEVFVPSQNGRIVPNKDLGGGNTTVHINVNAQAFMGSQIQARQFAQQIMGHLQDIAASKNTTVSNMMGG